MRHYLDTNILIFILKKNKDDLSCEIDNILKDYSSILYVSSIVIAELIFLFKINKIYPLLKHKTELDIIHEITELYGIKIVDFNKKHLAKYTSLVISEGHKDMNDHAIITQAISDKIPLISSDAKFKDYVAQGLNFIYNKR